MFKHFSLDLVFTLWKKKNSSTILSKKFNKYMKLTKIAMV
jgi:hypothetical protein